MRENDGFSDLQIQNFIILVEQDTDSLMAGSALKQLFLSDKLTLSQFERVEHVLMNFGSWALKLIE